MRSHSTTRTSSRLLRYIAVVVIAHAIVRAVFSPGSNARDSPGNRTVPSRVPGRGSRAPRTSLAFFKRIDCEVCEARPRMTLHILSLSAFLSGPPGIRSDNVDSPIRNRASRTPPTPCRSRVAGTEYPSPRARL